MTKCTKDVAAIILAAAGDIRPAAPPKAILVHIEAIALLINDDLTVDELFETGQTLADLASAISSMLASLEARRARQ